MNVMFLKKNTTIKQLTLIKKSFCYLNSAIQLASNDKVKREEIIYVFKEADDPTITI